MRMIDMATGLSIDPPIAWMTRAAMRVPRLGASAHNSYVEILAESGIAGFLAFLAAFAAIATGIVRVLRAVRRQPLLYLCMRATLVMLVVILLYDHIAGFVPEEDAAVMSAAAYLMLESRRHGLVQHSTLEHLAQ